MRGSSIGVVVFAAGTLACAVPAQAELIVVESGIDSIKPGTRLDDNAESTLPLGVKFRLFDPKTGKTFEIKGKGPPGSIGIVTGDPTKSPIGATRGIGAPAPVPPK